MKPYLPILILVTLILSASFSYDVVYVDEIEINYVYGFEQNEYETFSNENATYAEIELSINIERPTPPIIKFFASLAVSFVVMILIMRMTDFELSKKGLLKIVVYLLGIFILMYLILYLI